MKAEHTLSCTLNAAGNNRPYNSRQLESTSLASYSSWQEDWGVSDTNDQAVAETYEAEQWTYGDPCDPAITVQQLINEKMRPLRGYRQKML